LQPRTTDGAAMVTLFLGSTGDRSGQSLIAWAIARRLKERGLRVGFLKPQDAVKKDLGTPQTDPDAELMGEVLGLDGPVEQLCPQLPADGSAGTGSDEISVRVLQPLVREISREKDVLLIMGSREIFLDDAARPVSDISMVQGLDAHFVLVSRYRDTSHSLYSILSICSLLRERVKGIFLNRVPPDMLQALRAHMDPFLNSKGLPPTTILGEDPLLSCRSLREIAAVTAAEILSGFAKMEQPVEAMTLGSGHLSGELGVFRRVYNKIVLLEPSSTPEGESNPEVHRRIAGLMLTAGRKPPPVVLDAAQRADVPLLLVRTDTFATLDLLERVPPRLSARDGVKVQRLTEMLDHDGALDRLLRVLHLA